MSFPRTGLMVGAMLLYLPIALAGEPIDVVRKTSGHSPREPQIAVDADGNIHVAFGMDQAIMYTRVASDGKQVEKPVVVGKSHVFAVGGRRGPRIAVAGNAICIAAIGGDQGKGRDGDVLAFRSTDSGKTWSAPTLVNGVPGSAREGLHALASGPNGELCAVWLDLRAKKTEIYASTSTDGGEHWSKNVLVYRSPDGSVCECCHPSVAIDRNGKIFVMWRNSIKGARDMYFTHSIDHGTTYAAATKLGVGSWQLEACPMDGGALAITPDGKVSTAWRRENQVFLTIDAGRERLIGKGNQPWLAASDKGPIVVWLEDRTSALYSLSPQSQHPIKLANKAVDPVAASPLNDNARLVVAWEDHSSSEVSLKVQILD